MGFEYLQLGHGPDCLDALVRHPPVRQHRDESFIGLLCGGVQSAHDGSQAFLQVSWAERPREISTGPIGCIRYMSTAQRNLEQQYLRHLSHINQHVIQE